MAEEDYAAEYKSQYFSEGPLPEFTYVSYKWIARGKCLEEYIRPELQKDFLGKG